MHGLGVDGRSDCVSVCRSLAEDPAVYLSPKSKESAIFPREFLSKLLLHPQSTSTRVNCCSILIGRMRHHFLLAFFPPSKKKEGNVFLLKKSADGMLKHLLKYAASAHFDGKTHRTSN
jgi:hypothetical protein